MEKAEFLETLAYLMREELMGSFLIHSWLVGLRLEEGKKFFNGIVWC